MFDEYDGYKIVIKRKRIKNIYLRVKDNTLYITCPFYVTNNEVIKFIEIKKDWIIKIKNKRIKDSKIVINDYIFYKGNKYSFVVLKGNKSINIENNTVYIRCRSGIFEDGVDTFYELSKKELLKDINDIKPKYLNILKDYGYLKDPVFNIKKLKSMWGVCYNKKNIVNISCRLIHFETKYLEAIVWHELLHFILPNHSKRYYDVLCMHMSNYKDLIKELK